jgi:trigger factor
LFECSQPLVNLGAEVNKLEIKEYYIEKNIAHASIDFSAEEVNEYFQKVYQELKPNFSVPGFRKGKIPYEIFKKYVEPRKYFEEVTYQFVAKGTEMLFKEKKDDDFVQLPVMDNTNLPIENEPYTLKLKTEIYPKIELPEITSLTLPITIDKTAETIEQEKINALLDANSTYIEAEGNPQNGQYLLLDYQFAESKEKMDPKEFKPAMIEIGKNLLYPDTDERILSVPMGTTEILSLGEDGKEPLFLMVKPVALKSKELPKFDQDFLDSIHAEKTLDVFMEETKNSASAEAETYLKNLKIDAFFEHMIKTLPFEDLPQVLVEEHIEEEIYELRENLKKSKLELNEFLEKTGKTMDSLRDDYKPRAEFLTKVNLVFRALAKKYPEITPSAEIIEKEKAVYLGKYKKEEIDERELERFLIDNSIKRNAITFITDKVNFSSSK